MTVVIDECKTATAAFLIVRMPQTKNTVCIFFQAKPNLLVDCVVDSTQYVGSEP